MMIQAAAAARSKPSIQAAHSFLKAASCIKLPTLCLVMFVGLLRSSTAFQVVSRHGRPCPSSWTRQPCVKPTSTRWLQTVSTCSLRSKSSSATLCSPRQSTSRLLSSSSPNDPSDTDPNYQTFADRQRRLLWTQSAIRVSSFALVAAGVAILTRPVWAASKSRTDGYAVVKSEDDWKATLSSMQYFVLRQGGTERPYFSILESEKRSGVYHCAACNTPLFDARDKFTSGTGWPSFARGLDGVETESVDLLTANLSGAELRCKTCGGHLGDVFRDGFLFWGTEAAKTNRRYCIDGAALNFYPSGETNGSSQMVRGDTPAADASMIA
jgi:peptide-methionine (R)-S-oxide reductase